MNLFRSSACTSPTHRSDNTALCGDIEKWYYGSMPVGFYSRLIFPRIIDWRMNDAEMTKIRKELLDGVSGTVFELGFGTGLNLPHYPAHIKSLVTADPNPGMRAAAQKRIADSPIEVDCRVLPGEALPFDDASFDTVVCTWTLCSVPDAERVLAQCHRVLRPGGRFFFAEHGLADDPRVQKWQTRLNPFWRIVADGCNLNRNIKELVQDSHFRFEKLENFCLPGSSKFSGYMYQGVAVKD